MADGQSGDPLLDSFQQWQLGIALIFVLSLSASAGATAFQLLGVPYGTGIGTLAGAVLAFLAISYWYYGR